MRLSLGTSAVIAAMLVAPAGSPRPAPDKPTVILLGTGSPVPDPKMQGPATAVLVAGRVFLFDAGSGVTRQLTAAGVNLRQPTIAATFITHLHSDHTLGLADLILTTWILKRHTPLRMTGPPGLKAMVDNLMAAYKEDIDVRTNGLEHDSAGGWRVSVQETKGGLVFDSGGVRVTAFAVEHGSWPVALGYRIDAPGRSIVISGDTRPDSAVLREARGVDVLVHEVYPQLAPPRNAGERADSTYFAQFHTSAVELGRLAAQAQPKLLLMTHIVYRGANADSLIAQVRRAGFKGLVVVGKDLGRY